MIVRFRTAAVAIAIVALVTLGMTSCSAPTMPSASPEAEATLSAADARACRGYSVASSKFAAVSAATPAVGVEEYASAMETFAYELGKQSVAAEDGSAVEGALEEAAQVTAATTDSYRATGEISTSDWLAFQTSITTVDQLCGLPLTNFG